jgi:hypothetical protein
LYLAAFYRKRMEGAAMQKALHVEDVANLFGISKRTVHEMTRLGRIPHRIYPHTRRCVFEESWLEDWANGAPLETQELAGGGRVVKPVYGTPSS